MKDKTTLSLERTTQRRINRAKLDREEILGQPVSTDELLVFLLDAYEKDLNK